LQKIPSFREKLAGRFCIFRYNVRNAGYAPQPVGNRCLYDAIVRHFGGQAKAAAGIS